MVIDKYVEVIEECIRYVGLDPEECWDDGGEYWTFYKGSAMIKAYIFSIERGGEEEHYLSFESPIMELPDENRENLFERLLNENAQRIAVKFSIRDSWIVCETNRELEGIDFNEALRCLFRVAEVADALDDELKESFADE
ncbi:MAG: YbjN domain-containing protein [bacterium]|nr:YbjN domain-containing protein [bacterium]